MIVHLHTGVRLFLSLGLFLSLVALIVVIMLVVRAISKPGRWHERSGPTRLIQSTGQKGMLASP